MVTLTDSVTKQRRDYWLGIYDTAGIQAALEVSRS